jgi:hypothetical protein
VNFNKGATNTLLLVDPTTLEHKPIDEPSDSYIGATYNIRIVSTNRLIGTITAQIIDFAPTRVNQNLNNHISLVRKVNEITFRGVVPVKVFGSFLGRLEVSVFKVTIVSIVNVCIKLQVAFK